MKLLWLSNILTPPLASMLYDICYHSKEYTHYVVCNSFENLNCIACLQFIGCQVLLQTSTQDTITHINPDVIIPLTEHTNIKDERIVNVPRELMNKLAIAPGDYIYRVQSESKPSIIVGKCDRIKGVQLEGDPVKDIYTMLKAKAYINTDTHISKQLLIAAALRVPIMSVKSEEIYALCGRSIAYIPSTYEDVTECMLDRMFIVSKQKCMRLIINEFKQLLH